MTLASSEHRSVWPHALAVALACVTFPLIWVGGLVTTYDAGMAVPDWPTTYGYNMFLYPWSTWLTGPWDLFIEHGHRLLGSLAGLLTIALAVAVWCLDKRKWLGWVSIAALLLVILQGLLGGMRVRMDDTDLARLHGCTGPLFFSLVIVICVMTSRYWTDFGRETTGNVGVRARVVAGGWLVFLLAYLQLVLGAFLRHPGVTWHPSVFRGFVVMHLITAAFLVLQASSIAWSARKYDQRLARPALLLATLVGAQLVLGILTWRAKYGWPTFLPIPESWTVSRFTLAAESMEQAITVTSHVAVGSLILATSVCYATRLTRFFIASAHSRNRATAPDSYADSYSSLTRVEGAMS
jgi:cytochrome c oxidase assembly protein subunit 15